MKKTQKQYEQERKENIKFLNKFVENKDFKTYTHYFATTNPKAAVEKINYFIQKDNLEERDIWVIKEDNRYSIAIKNN